MFWRGGIRGICVGLVSGCERVRVLGILLHTQGFGAALGCGGADVIESRLGKLPLLRWLAQDIGGQGKLASYNRKNGYFWMGMVMLTLKLALDTSTTSFRREHQNRTKCRSTPVLAEQPPLRFAGLLNILEHKGSGRLEVRFSKSIYGEFFRFAYCNFVDSRASTRVDRESSQGSGQVRASTTRRTQPARDGGPQFFSRAGRGVEPSKFRSPVML